MVRNEINCDLVRYKKQLQQSLLPIEDVKPNNKNQNS